MRRVVLAQLAALLLLLTVPAHAEAPPGFGWPLGGTPVVDRGFQPPTSSWGAGHRGVDLRGHAGELVLAAAAGRVTYAGLLAGRGVVSVTHAHGLRTTYEPVTPSVRVGQVVTAGTVIGRLAGGHASCQPGTVCLHWGLLRGDSYLDPLGLVVDQRVRLLPLGIAPSPAALLTAGSSTRRVSRTDLDSAVAARPSGRSGFAHELGAVGSLAVGLRLLARLRRRTS